MAKKIVWSDEARADVRAIDRTTALGLLEGLARFAFTIEILRVRHRKEAYR